MSMVALAERYMSTTRKQEVLQTDLLKYVSGRTGYSLESVRGSIIGTRGGKLFGTGSFQRRWDVCRRAAGKGARFIRKGAAAVSEVYEVSYDTPTKKAARERGLACLPDSPCTVMTLASNEGHCVKYIMDKNPANIIHNVEFDRDVLNQWQSQGFNTEDYLGTVSSFIRTQRFRETHYAALNLDLMGYLCGGLNDDLAYLNNLDNWDHLVLTLQGIRNFRNHGRFVSWAKRRYRRYADPTQRCLKETLSSATLQDAWFYRRDPSKDCRDMRMFVFGR